MGLVNSFALHRQFDWAFHNITPKGELCHGWNSESYGVDETVCYKTLILFPRN